MLSAPFLKLNYCTVTTTTERNPAVKHLIDDDIFNHILSAPSLKAPQDEYTAEEILQRRQEGSAAMSQAASLGKDIAGADGKTMIGEACADTAQPCSQRLKLRVYDVTNQAILA